MVYIVIIGYKYFKLHFAAAVAMALIASATLADEKMTHAEFVKLWAGTVLLKGADFDLSPMAGDPELIDIAAQLDGQNYFMDHDGKTDGDSANLKIGTAHAFRHHLLGQPVSEYAVTFVSAIEAMAADMKK